MNRPREAALGVAAALVPVVALPFLVSHSPLLRRVVLWAAPGLPSALISIGILVGAGEVFLSWRSRAASPRFVLLKAVGPAAAIAAFMLPLLFAWCTAPSGGYSLFGLLPRSDGGNYYLGARELLETGRLGDWNSRRPLNAALLAVRLATTGNSLQAVQVIQVVLLSLAAYALSRKIAKDLGCSAGILLFALLLAYSRSYIHWLSSEWLGLTLGALGTAHLWDAARDGRKALLAWGMVVMTLALNARAGTFLVLPALLLWAGFSCRGKKMFHWGGAALAGAGILAGFLVNASIMKIYGSSPGLGHGNFSLTLYGLASGKPGWRQIHRDYPETRGMAEEAVNEFAYRRSYELITEDPSRLMGSLADASRSVFREFPHLRGWWAGLARDPSTRKVVALFLAAGGLVFLLRARRRPEITMISASLAGFLASVPFLWVDGEARIYAATFPIPAVLLSLGICAWKRRVGLPPAEETSPERPRRASLLVFASAGLVAVAVAGPALAFRAGKTGPALSVHDSDARETVVIRSDAPHIIVPSRGSGETTCVPRVRRFDYLRNLPEFEKEDFGRLPRPGAVYFARDWLVPATTIPFDKYVWVVGPAAMVGEEPRYLLLRGSYRRETNVFHVSAISPVPDVPRGPGGE